MPAKQNSKKKSPDTRIRKLDYRSKKRAVRTSSTIPGSLRIFRQSVSHIWQNKKLFGGILLVYAILYVVFVRGLATNFQLGETRQAIEEAVDGELGSLQVGIALFGALVGTSSSTSGEAAGVYQSAIFIIISLSIIWSLRQTYNTKKQLKIRQAFYQGMYSLVPYILVWLAIILQMLPALIGITLYGIVSTNGIAVGVFEQIIWLLITLLSIGVSIFFVSSSIFASYIVALPDIAPMSALRKARSLVKFRRFLVIRKLLFLPLVIIVVMVVVFLPLVIYATVVAEVMFLIFSLLLILLSHAYIYNLYREML